MGERGADKTSTPHQTPQFSWRGAKTTQPWIQKNGKNCNRSEKSYSNSLFFVLYLQGFKNVFFSNQCLRSNASAVGARNFQQWPHESGVESWCQESHSARHHHICSCPLSDICVWSELFFLSLFFSKFLLFCCVLFCVCDRVCVFWVSGRRI